MDPLNIPSENVPAPQTPLPQAMTNDGMPTQPMQMICPRCHFGVRPEYYYCPNCGAKLSDPPLPTDFMTQFLLYGFSIVLPWIAYLAVSKWQGIKYLRAPDEKAKLVGMIMLALLVISSAIAFWQAYIWIQGYVQQSVNDVNNLGI